MEANELQEKLQNDFSPELKPSKRELSSFDKTFFYVKQILLTLEEPKTLWMVCIGFSTPSIEVKMVYQC